jgi:hypothetical protein
LIKAGSSCKEVVWAISPVSDRLLW